MVDIRKAIIRRILKTFEADDLQPFVSGVNDADSASIDDGSAYGDIKRDTRPDFVKKDDNGWDSIANSNNG
jgi:hypothetical protein